MYIVTSIYEENDDDDAKAFLLCVCALAVVNDRDQIDQTCERSKSAGASGVTGVANDILFRTRRRRRERIKKRRMREKKCS